MTGQPIIDPGVESDSPAAASPAIGTAGSESAPSADAAAPLAYEIITVPAVGEPGRNQLKQQCFDVRIAVFSVEQGFPLETEIDDLDETATHLLLRLVPSLEPIGTIRGTYHTPADKQPYYKLSRLVVLAKFRAHKLGAALVLALHSWALADAAARGATAGTIVRVVCHSQLYVKKFYARFGYKPEGAEFDEDGAPHQRMVARLQVP